MQNVEAEPVQTQCLVPDFQWNIFDFREDFENQQGYWAPTFQCEVCKNIHHFSDSFCPFYQNWILISQNPMWKSKCNYEAHKLRNNYLPDKLILSIIGSSMTEGLFYKNIYEGFMNLFTGYELLDRVIIWLFVKLLQTWESLK